ncbi:MAG: hypothetical protein BGO78_08040 [Chloroflexi bacterium 44-23]|nr:MAG: hypothetical protein BGO78_08040 [Chloroflexi bacterium 44-23]
MLKKTLIAYASKTGSTQEIANYMGHMLQEKGQEVVILPVKSVADISQYNSIILGSAIRIGKLLPEAMAFVENNLAELKKKKFGVFIVCMTLNEDTMENRKIVSDYLNPLRAIIKPDSEGFFAGKIDFRRLKLLEKLIVKALKVPEGDYRKWDQIDAWSGNLFLN